MLLNVALGCVRYQKKCLSSHRIKSHIKHTNTMKTTKTKLMTPDEREALGRELLAWRVRNRATQSQAGAAIGVSRFTIARIEKESEQVDDKTAYRAYAYLVRELKREREVLQRVDEQYITHRAAALNSELTTLNDFSKDWQLQK